MAKIFTPQVFAEILNLVGHGFSAAEIANRIGCKLSSLRVKCSQQGICLRRHSKRGSEVPQERLTIKLSGSTALRLQQQAGKKGVSGTRYAAALLEAIVRDNLYDAVIDQEAAIRPAPMKTGDPCHRNLSTAKLEPFVELSRSVGKGDVKRPLSLASKVDVRRDEISNS
jgi:hypothetical protein